jgi:hypothetical protein
VVSGIGGEMIDDERNSQKSLKEHTPRRRKPAATLENTAASNLIPPKPTEYDNAMNALRCQHASGTWHAAETS